MSTLQISFCLPDKGEVSLELPIVNGGINTNKYFPEEILFENVSNDSFIGRNIGNFGKMIPSTDSDEIKDDLNYMLHYIHTNKYTFDGNSAYDFLDILTNSIDRHLQKFRRLLFPDLCTYIDLTAYLMSVYDFNETTIRNFYIWAIYSITGIYQDLVKEFNPYTGIIPFSQTNKYRNIKRLVSKLDEDALL